jgi:hypothetical protein
LFEQGKVDRPLRENYKAEFASRDPQERGTLGRKLREMADKENDPAAKFVLLREARDLAIDAGDLSYSFAVIDDMATTFRVDAQEMKVTAIAFGIDKTRVPPQDLARSFLKVCDESLAVWNTELAMKAAYAATKVAAGNRDLMADAKAHEKIARLCHTAWVKAATANQKLERSPNDPAANQIVGVHICFNTNRWEVGLAYLAKSPPGPLKTLAERDLANPADPAAMAALADAWWDFADAKAAVPDGAGRRRAAFWYAKALPGLSGEKKAAAEKRIAEMSEGPKP